MEYFKLNNNLIIPAIGMGTGWMNPRYRNPIYLLKRVLIELQQKLEGKYSKDNKYNTSYELRKRFLFSKSIRQDAKIGYELFDTAYSYNNCLKLGKALKLQKERKRYFLISKCSNFNQRNGTVFEEFEQTLKELKTDYIDLYLIHWPQTGCFINTWHVLEDMYIQGKVKAIGVSNFSIRQLTDLLNNCRIKPMVNEIECHPLLQQIELRDFCRKNDITIIAHTPTGKMTSIIKKTSISDIAKKYNKTIAQIILRWHYQMGDVSIPNSLSFEHACENLKIFDFNLSSEDMDVIKKLDCNNRIWPDPENCDFTKL